MSWSPIRAVRRIANRSWRAGFVVGAAIVGALGLVLGAALVGC